MGEVDLLDSLIVLFHTKIDQRNGIIASYFTLIMLSKMLGVNAIKHNDLIIVQAWLLYRRESRGTGVPAKEKMSLCNFKLYIAECLSIQTAKTRSKKTRKNKCSFGNEEEERWSSSPSCQGNHDGCK